MMKQYMKEQLNAILDVGFASREDTAGFKEVKHDPYVEALQSWLHSYGSNWAEQPRFSITQGLIDRGVDLKVEFKIADYVVGFQVWSYNDIKRKELEKDIWRQIGESGSYHLNDFYVILCGDMTDPSQYQKVRRFIDLVERGRYPLITVIPPEKAWKLYQAFKQPIDVQQIESRLTSLARFLNAIGRQQELHTQNSVYFNLDQLYVPPAEYSQIEQTLETNDIVIIVGPPHLGKTYTAVKLLYKYYLQGYQPSWVFSRITREDIQLPSLQDIYHQYGIRDSFTLESMIAPGCIVYLEDPYGRTKREELEFVHSERRFEIGDLLLMLKSRSHIADRKPKVVITSREGIFRHAIQLQPELSKHAVWLKAGDDTEDELISYSFASRVEIVKKYMRLYKPSWLQLPEDSRDEALKNIEEILSWAANLLWTPHGIRRFFQASRNMDLRDADALKKVVLESADISDSFASEIGLLPYTQQLVFVVIYLANFRKRGQPLSAGPSKVDNEYLALVQALGFSLDEAQDAWGQVIESYATIIEAIQRALDSPFEVDLVRFAHPAYDDAVFKFLSNNPDVLENIFAHIPPLLQSQSGTHLAQDMVGLIHHWHQHSPSEEARVLKNYLTTDNESLLTELAEEYALLYPNIENETLKSAIHQIPEHPIARSDNSPVRQVFVRAAHIARSMPLDKRCEILLEGLGDNPLLMWKSEYRPYDLICRYYDKVTDEAREHLENYLNSGSDAWWVVGRSLGNYYDCLPQHLQQAAETIATTDTLGSFIARKELIIGLILGFGQFNNSANHLIHAMSTSEYPKTRAYLAGALVPVYDQLDQKLRKKWHHLVEEDLDQCTIAAAERIIELSTKDKLANALKANGLFDFALNCAESGSAVVRAEMLGILLENQGKIPTDNVERVIDKLIHDDVDIVRAAALYWMLGSRELQTELPERFQTLVTDTSVCAKLSKLIFYTNPPSKASNDLSQEIEELKDTDSRFLYNALVFHIAAQLPFLPSSWKEWLKQELAKGERDTEGIVNIGKWYHREDDRVRPIFEPNWVLNYAEPAQLIWYEPRKRFLIMDMGRNKDEFVIIKNLDELDLIFDVKQEIPNYLVC
ncbi:MAG: hypothetical protein WBW48_18840 [Anaerolineae bacterium]